MRIRPTAETEFEILRDIERAAGACFLDIGMRQIAEDEPPSMEELAGYLRAGGSWVAVDDADAPVAYLIAAPLDEGLHIEQVSVHPRAARRGVGRALIEHAARYASAEARKALTLTTFAEVPWNAPYYLRCGFRIVPDADLTPGLRAIHQRETAMWLDRWRRVCMRREV